MKKIISLGLGLLLALSLITLPVSAATASPEIDDVVSDVEAEDAAGYDVNIKLDRLDKTEEGVKPENDDEKIIASYSVEIEGNPQYPVRIKMKVAGIKLGSKVFVVTKDKEGKLTRTAAKVIADGMIEFSIDKTITSLTLIADKKSASDVGTSDKTGNYAFVFPVLALCVAGASVLVLKKRA